MSLAVLYHGLGLRGYRHLRGWQEGGAIYLKVEKAEKRCRLCQSKMVTQKGWKRRVLRVLPLGNRPVFAVVKMRRLLCHDCRKLRYENLQIADSKKHYTHGLENFVMDLCSRMTIRDVAEHTGLHWATVKAIDRKRLRRNLPKNRDLKGLRYLGIDEVSVRRGRAIGI